MDCTCNQPKEIRMCTAVTCPLYPYRMGTRPSEATLHSLTEYFGENIELTAGFLMKKASVVNEMED